MISQLYLILEICTISKHKYICLFGTSNSSGLYELKNFKIIKPKNPVNISNLNSACIISPKRKINKLTQEQTKLLHAQLGQTNYKNMLKMIKNKSVEDITTKNLAKHLLTIDCQACVLGKQTRASFNSNPSRTSTIRVYLVHSDLVGPMKVPCHTGEKYFLLFIDDYSRMVFSFLIHRKSQTFECFKIFDNTF